MVRLHELPEPSHSHVADLDCPTFAATPWVEGPPLARRRVAILSTAGLQRRGDRPFSLGAGDFRVIPGDLPASELVMSHVSTNFDRTGFQQDLNVVFPVDRLAELAADGTIGSVADFHYSFMGASDPRAMEPDARAIARLLLDDGVDACFLVPV
jgi:D-proline reductase (dithiol) PrdB